MTLNELSLEDLCGDPVIFFDRIRLEVVISRHVQTDTTGRYVAMPKPSLETVTEWIDELIDIACERLSKDGGDAFDAIEEWPEFRARKLLAEIEVWARGLCESA